MDLGQSMETKMVDSENINSEMDIENDEVEHNNITSSTSEDSYPSFETLYENVYLGSKKKRVNKEIRRMSCDCSYCPDEVDFAGCGDDCLNRLLMIECNSRCPCGEFCSNRKFQEGQKVRVEAFRTEKKGWGLRTLEDISAHQFVMEYCGEVMGYEEFEKRVEVYDKENRRHYYFMTLRADEIIDATYKGNLSRFINHSCSPNCETQKWTVNGYLRIGFFTIKDIAAGTELTFDYKFQRYGKKAQVCFCESLNCRGIIGGEKHTPLKSIISGRPASPARASSPRRNRRRRLAEQFDDKPLELEIAQLLAGDKGIKTDDQALKLSQFMVRAETTSQRLLLLDALAATVDPNCLRNFLRYQGLSLLWSWMVDLGENSPQLQKKIVQVLKHLPVANLNQVKDTKVLRVISKWAKKPVTGVPEEETSSSDVDSRGLSPPDASEDASRHISSSSDELQNSSKNVESLKAKDGDVSKSDAECKMTSSVDDTVFEPGEVRSNEELKPEEQKPENLNPDEQKPEGPEADEQKPWMEGLKSEELKSEGLKSEELKSEELKSEELKSEGLKSEGLKSEGLKSEGLKSVGLKSEGLKPTRMKVPHRNRSVYNRIFDRVGDSSEEESRWSEDDTTSSDSESIVDLAADLLDQWSSLKEVYRIPKKSTVVVQREPESTSGTSEGIGSTAESSQSLRTEKSTPTVPKIDEDLFKKDEFLSKLGEREFHNSKSFQRDASSSEIPSLMSSAASGAGGYAETGDGAHDSSKVPIHQRLQSYANTANEGKDFQGWQGKGGGRRGNRKGAYLSPRGPTDRPSRHQAPGKSQFNQPNSNPQMHTLTIPNNPWHTQESSSYGSQYPHDAGVQPGYPAAGQNTTTTVQTSYYQPSAEHTTAGEQTGYQSAWNTNQPSYGQDQGSSHVGYGQLPPPPPQRGQVPPTQGQFPPTSGQMPTAHGQYVPGYASQTPFGYQQPANQNQAYPVPMFNPAQPYMATQSNPQYPAYPLQQFPANPATYSTPPNVPPPYSVNPTPAQLVPEQPQPSFAPREQQPGSNTSMVSSTVGGSESMDIVQSSSKLEWSSESYSKTQDVPLPPDWKKAYDGEGRAYFYHVVTRQTQWEPPVSDHSPPTPELGYLGDELDSRMDPSLFSSHVPQEVTMEVVDSTKRKKPRTPSTPPGSPPKSPVSKYTTAAADTTDVRKGLYSPSSLLQGRHLTPEQRKLRETFRTKLSAVVVNHLNPYHKLDCKIGRITTVDDFKFLARKLTHGVMVKELSRLKDESQLVCNDSVKIKTKEYIRNYMQKFGAVYKPS